MKILEEIHLRVRPKDIFEYTFELSVNPAEKGAPEYKLHLQNLETNRNYFTHKLQMLDLLLLLA